MVARKESSGHWVLDDFATGLSLTGYLNQRFIRARKHLIKAAEDTFDDEWVQKVRLAQASHEIINRI